ncbi:hypothetical protein [Aquamicrobium terrae]|uniref:Myosin heavy subunit n=1 Tax=Aquamicrobium terrae TaxID=1324945 RepID=A0ABV2MYD4_9HYPH
MVQSILFFLLGFLCAGFIALLLAPPIWRRAVTLTHRRLEAALPLTQAELRADKDRVRAEFAMQARRLEMTIEALRDKEAGHKVEIGRMQEQARIVDADKAELSRTISDMEARNAALAAQLEEAGAKAAKQEADLAQVRQELVRRDEEHAKLSRMYEEASFLASSRQIELVARESELERQSTDIGQLRTQIRQLEQANRDSKAESDNAREALKVEQKRATDLDDRVQRLLGTVADRDEKLERRERELARTREKAKGASQGKRAAGKASAKRQAVVDGEEVTLARLKADRDRLERRLIQNKGTEAGSAIELREQMAALAAEVVHMTALREGTGSPIAKLLAVKEGEAIEESAAAKDCEQAGVISLAQRVRSLQDTQAGS